MRRRRLAALLLGAAVAGGLVLAAEAWCRAQEASLVYLWDSGRRFATRPGVGGANADSFHERDLRKGPSVARRVVVVGDSMAWGTGPAEEAFPGLTEAALGPPWQVLNLSHYGYDAAQSAAVLREHGWAYEPELVVYASYTNDPLPSRVIEVGGGPVWIAGDGLLPSPLRRASALIRRAEGALLAGTLTEAPDWDFYRAALTDMRDQARERGVPLAVFGLVPHVLADGDAAACSARLGRPGHCEAHLAIARDQAVLARHLRLPYVSGLDAWKRSGRADFYPADPADWQHPNAEGHALLAARLAELVREHDRGELRP